MADVHWIATKSMYPQLVKGGEDKASGQTLYVGRGNYGGCVLPGKVLIPKSGMPELYVAQDKQQHVIDDFEMLVTTEPMMWVPSHDGGYPPDAIPGGTNKDESTLYIARARAPDGKFCPGMLNPPDKKCTYAFDDKEYQNIIYEVLAEKKKSL